MARLRSYEELRELGQRIAARPHTQKPCVSVCAGTGCRASGAEEVAEAFKEAIASQGVQDGVDLKLTGCHGFCERGPVVVLHPEKTFYQRVAPDDAEEIVCQTVLKGQLIERLLYVDPVSGEKIVKEPEVPFYQKQQRMLLGQNGIIDPTNIEDYLAVGGYTGLAQALSAMSPEQVVAEVARSGLRGRGGAGFPTGRKWQVCRTQPGQPKHIVCNADEGDPGAFQDRSLLEGNPHSVIEGMVIGAYAIGASEGHVYVRSEYPLAVKHIETALQQAEECGLLGDDILGSGLSFDISVHRGAGAFVCGEETGLIASLEGQRGMPRPRPPFPAERGLWGQPTNINNVKTWASVPLIIRNGAEWFAGIGTEQSKGTMIFSLVGKINNTGLVEVPMGITLRELIYGIGGGVPDGREFKAVQTGGPSGGCIPADLIDLPVDYERLTEVGSMMGSGGMVVMDDDTCMVDVAKYFLSFTQEESCGKCPPCRVGTRAMLTILERITEDRGSMADLDKLEELAHTVKDASLCGLGQTAPNPVLTTLRYFRHEYEEHIQKRQCPAFVCSALLRYHIARDRCAGCGACARACPVEAISGEKDEPHVLDQEVCIQCGACLSACPARYAAVYRTSGELTRFEERRQRRQESSPAPQA